MLTFLHCSLSGGRVTSFLSLSFIVLSVSILLSVTLLSCSQIPSFKTMTNIEEVDARTNFDSKVGPEKNSNDHERANESSSTRSSNERNRLAKIKDHQYARACWEFVTWTPKRCRWHPESPPKFSLGLNLLFGFVSISYSDQIGVYEIPFYYDVYVLHVIQKSTWPQEPFQ
jgi:hypothetical protein